MILDSVQRGALPVLISWIILIGARAIFSAPFLFIASGMEPAMSNACTETQSQPVSVGVSFE